MKKVALMVALLITTNSALADTQITGAEAAEIIKEGEILAVELAPLGSTSNETSILPQWNILVTYDDSLFYCIFGDFKLESAFGICLKTKPK